MTVERVQEASPLEPQASLRTELVGQLASAQLALEAAIAELSRNGGDATAIAISRLQLTSLISLRQQIGTATGSALAELRSEVTAAASSATALAQQANGRASSANAPDAVTRAAAARQTIENVGRDIFDKKVLDPYLQFTSKEDEDAYRKREQERKDARDRALKLGTPEGDRLAAQITKEQLRDAGAHGADRSPNFAPMQQDIDQASADLETAIAATKASPVTAPSAKSQSKTGGELDDISAALNAAGVTTTDGVAPHSTHGLAKGLQAARGQGSATGRM